MDAGRDANATGEELTTGLPAPPRPSASVILVRGGRAALEVLLVRRNPAARFMGGAWVFPGGAVDEHEGHGAAARRRAAVREALEEAGVRLPGPDALVAFSRWITPEAVRIRFDTSFFVAPLPDGERARPDGAECVEARWLAPAEALAAHGRGELALVFPTIRHLEELARFNSANELLARARDRRVVPVLPRVVRDGRTTRVVLPGEPGYDDG